MSKPWNWGGVEYVRDVWEFIDDLALRLYQLHDDIAGVAIIGTWLSEPFAELSIFIQNADENLYHVYEGYDDILNQLWDALQLDWIEQMLINIWSEWSDFHNDPVGWVRGKLYNLITDVDTLIDNAPDWIMNRIQDGFPDVYDWLTDWHMVIDEWMFYNYHPVYLLFHDPGRGLLTLAAIISTELADFFQEPHGTIFIQVLNLFGLSPSFAADPKRYFWEWLIDGVETYIDDLKDSLYQLSERVIRLFWEGIF